MTSPIMTVVERGGGGGAGRGQRNFCRSGGGRVKPKHLPWQGMDISWNNTLNYSSQTFLYVPIMSLLLVSPLASSESAPCQATEEDHEDGFLSNRAY